MKNLSALITTFLLLQLNTFAQAPDTMWTKTFGGNNGDWCAAVQKTADGGYIIVGNTESFGTGSSDVWLIKTDVNGDTLWTRTFGGSGADGGNYGQQTSDSGFVITGFTSPSTPRYADIWLIKTDVNGDTLWTRTFIGNYGASVQQTSDSGYVIVGQTVYHEVWLIKTNANGDTVWIKDLGGNEDAYCASVQQTFDSGYVVTGFKPQPGGGAGDVWLIKTNASGEITWEKTFGGDYHDEGNSVQQTSDEGYIIAGFTAGFGGIGSDAWLIKTNASGDSIWTKTFDERDGDMGNSVQQTEDGGYIVAGFTYSFVGGNEDLLLIRTDANGNTLWTKTLGGIENDDGNSIQQTDDGGYIVGGCTHSFGAGEGDVWLIKLEGDAPSIVKNNIDIVDSYSLKQNHPNPFNPSTKIQYSIPQTSNVVIKIFDILGNEIETLVNEEKQTGTYEITWFAEGLPSGVYFYQLKAGTFIETKKMVLMK